jgi:hypothetical protein
MWQPYQVQMFQIGIQHNLRKSRPFSPKLAITAEEKSRTLILYYKPSQLPSSCTSVKWQPAMRPANCQAQRKSALANAPLKNGLKPCVSWRLVKAPVLFERSEFSGAGMVECHFRRRRHSGGVFADFLTCSKKSEPPRGSSGAEKEKGIMITPWHKANFSN